MLLSGLKPRVVKRAAGLGLGLRSLLQEHVIKSWGPLRGVAGHVVGVLSDTEKDPAGRVCCSRSVVTTPHLSSIQRLTVGHISFDDFQESRVTKWQKALGSRMSQMPSRKVVFYASVMTSGVCALGYYLLQKAFSRASYYQLGLEQLQSHPEALEALGPPLNVHHLQLRDTNNFVDIADAKLKIPVSGSKASGHLYVFSSRDSPFKRWHLEEVFLKLKDGQQIPVFKLRQEDGDEVKIE